MINAMSAALELIARRYEDFARFEARGRSPAYARIAQAIAVDRFMLSFSANTSAEIKRQPNLLLGAVRYLYGTPGDADDFLELARAHAEEIAAVMAARSTQTNEPARCATLLPVLAGLPQPLALLEVGAAAGLCLLPDRYAYDYGRVQIPPSRPGAVSTPVFSCRADAGTPLPECNVEVASCAGLDLHPIDLTDDTEIRWLEALIWPGEGSRLCRCCAPRARPRRTSAGDRRRSAR